MQGRWKLQQRNPINIPINKGARPDWQIRLGYPKAFNFYVGESGSLYSTPGKTKISPDAPDQDARAIHYSKYSGGRKFVVTKTKILYINSEGGFVEVATIKNSGLPVQIDENIQNQVGIVDGKKFYVYDQKANSGSGEFVIMGDGQGFELETPISIVVINTITVVLDKKTNTWVISDVNNMLTFPVWSPPTIDSQSTQAVSLEIMNNNLYIFGTTGIERWVPTTANSPYLFPFSKDTNYWVPFGGIATNGVTEGKNELFFLSSNYTPMVLNAYGYKDLIDPKDGFSRIISQYSDVNNCVCSYSTFRGNNWVYFTFVDTGISWVYNKNSNTMHQVDDLVIDSLQDYEVIATPEGIYEYSLTPDHKHRTFLSELVRLQKGTQPNRELLNAFELQIIQGQTQSPSAEERMELTLSLDGLSWTNTVWRPWGKTGHRNDVMSWSMNLAAQEVMYRVDYYGSLDLTISKATAYIQ